MSDLLRNIPTGLKDPRVVRFETEIIILPGLEAVQARTGRILPGHVVEQEPALTMTTKTVTTTLPGRAAGLEPIGRIRLAHVVAQAWARTPIARIRTTTRPVRAVAVEPIGKIHPVRRVGQAPALMMTAKTVTIILQGPEAAPARIGKTLRDRVVVLA